MPKCPQCNTDLPGLPQKKMLLLYSLYLALASVSFFIAFNLLNTAYQGYIWSYTTKYVLNSLAVALVLCIAGGLLLMGCYQVVKGKSIAKILGILGCLLLMLYPPYVYLIDAYGPPTYSYMLLLWTPALLVLISNVYLWKKTTKTLKKNTSQ